MMAKQNTAIKLIQWDRPPQEKLAGKGRNASLFQPTRPDKMIRNVLCLIMAELDKPAHETHNLVLRLGYKCTNVNVGVTSYEDTRSGLLGWLLQT